MSSFGASAFRPADVSDSADAPFDFFFVPTLHDRRMPADTRAPCRLRLPRGAILTAHRGSVVLRTVPAKTGLVGWLVL